MRLATVHLFLLPSIINICLRICSDFLLEMKIFSLRLSLEDGIRTMSSSKKMLAMRTGFYGSI